MHITKNTLLGKGIFSKILICAAWWRALELGLFYWYNESMKILKILGIIILIMIALHFAGLGPIYKTNGFLQNAENTPIEIKKQHCMGMSFAIEKLKHAGDTPRKYFCIGVVITRTGIIPPSL